MRLNFATVVEHMADALAVHPCLYYDNKIVSWKAYDDRSARIAQCFADHGLTKDSKVGLFLFNGTEYMESFLAAYKNRSIPININYRYVGSELEYLLKDCKAEALVFHSSLSETVAEVSARMPDLKLLICVDDGGAHLKGAFAYEDIIRSTEPAKRIERSPDDTLMLYTGGTTGMPKGVEYRIGDLVSELIRFVPNYLGTVVVETLDELVASAVERANNGQSFVSLPASPLMHTAGILNSGVLIQLHGGAMVILASRSFDPRELWAAVERHRVNHMVVVGDTFVKPMLKVLDSDSKSGIEYDLSSLRAMVSSGVMFSRESKARLLEYTDMVILDAVGATEGGIGVQISSRTQPPSETAKFFALPTTEIFDMNNKKLERGCGEIGMIGLGGTLPQGYFGDPEKTEKTFRVIDGHRFGFTGDMGSIDAQGILHLVGRGSNCINTGGEKVFPEEVEEVIKRHEAVSDCLVVGIPDDRFGESVAAIVSLSYPLRDAKQEIQDFCSVWLARYKMPRTIKIVLNVQRAPNGKADYKWAKTEVMSNQPE